MTRNDRGKVTLSAAEHQRLKRRAREVVRPDELDAAGIERIAETEPAAKAAAYDHEMSDKPS